MAKGNTRCKKPGDHVALSVEDGKRLSDEKWRKVAQSAANEMGYSQFVAVRHSDTGCDHIHVIGNRI